MNSHQNSKRSHEDEEMNFDSSASQSSRGLAMRKLKQKLKSQKTVEHPVHKSEKKLKSLEGSSQERYK